MEVKIKHLEMVEAVIERMARNSFALKGWAVALIAAAFIASGVSGQNMYFCIALLPLLVFWILDAHYLALERRYRQLYEQVRHDARDFNNFSMKISAPDSDLLWSCFLSKTERDFYVALMLVCGVCSLVMI